MENKIEIFEDYSDEELFSLCSICEEICIKLKTTGFVESIIKQCIHHFKVDKFIEKLDEKGNILCFGEDVYDLDSNKWRKTEQTDYCSKKCGVTKDEITDEHIDEFNGIFNNIFPNEERREYFLNLVSETLYGGNLKEIFQIWTGIGRNGKGLFMKYFVLKPSIKNDYGKASIKAVNTYAAEIVLINPQLAGDLLKWIDNIGIDIGIGICKEGGLPEWITIEG